MRILTIFLSVVLLVLFAAAGVLFVAFRGPSETTRDILTLSFLETSAAKFVPSLFLPGSLIDAIVEKNAVTETDDITDPALVTPFSPRPSPSPGVSEAPSVQPGDDFWADYPDGLCLEHIKGSTYRGYVLLIRDPSRVYTATSSDFQSGKAGVRILDAYNREGAVGAINGGGFPDEGGTGNGDVPLGIVFSKGKHMWGEENETYSSVAGFDNNNVLIVGNMSPARAKQLGIRDAVNFGPTLIKNGVASKFSASGSLAPRSAIGQTADGTVIFLCVDGRMTTSLGASFNDLVEVMLRYGAVNACNLDGGSSAQIVYGGEIVNVSASLTGARRIPTYFMVRP